MVKIIQDHENCIGCGSCAAICPKFWEMNYDEGKSFLKGGEKNEKGEYELEVQDVGCNQETVDCCPVQVIKIL
jgi:ferredoxin